MIRPRGRGYQAVVYAGMDERGRKQWLTGSALTKRDANALEARLKVQAADGRKPARQADTLGGLLRTWLAANAVWSPTTRYGYEHLVEKIDVDLGNVRLRTLTPARLDAYYTDLHNEGLSPRSIRNVHAVIRRACNQALRWGTIPSNPAVLATPPRVLNQEVNAPTHNQILQLLDAAESHDAEMYAAIYLDAVTGLRRGELCGLRWSDLQLSAKDPELSVAQNVVEAGGKPSVKLPKSHATRRLALDSEAVRVMRGHRSAVAERALACGVKLLDDGYVFSEDAAGTTPIRPSRLSARFRAIRKLAGLNGIRLHDLRHYHASTLIGDRVDPITVAARLGHKDSSVTLRIYSHAQRPADAAAAVAEVVSRVLAAHRRKRPA